MADYRVVSKGINMHVYTERFLSWDEAVDFVEKKRDEYARKYPNFEVCEMRVVLLGGIFASGITFSKKQGDLFE